MEQLKQKVEIDTNDNFSSFSKQSTNDETSCSSSRLQEMNSNHRT